MAGQVFSFFSHYVAQPFFDLGVIYIVVVDPALIAGIVRRINVDAFDFAFVFGKQRFQGFQIVSMDNHIFAAIVISALPVCVIAVLTFQYPIWHVLMEIDDFIFSDPLKSWHIEFLHT